mgnify:CR=1 FL=1
MNEKIKAKAYDEALERAKRLQHDNAWVTTIFPELKESEDEEMESEHERIRKLLVRFVKYEMPDNYSDDISKDSCLAYLEKQKEQKILQSDGIGAAILSALAGGIETDEILKVRGFTYDDVEKYLTLMEQKEQKPAEWSEEDKKKLEDIIMCGEKHLYLDDGNIDWVKSLPERFDLRPRQEWTLYDEKLLGEVMVAVETDKFFSEQDQKRIVSWLRSLRPYPQDMKESVWRSEVDEEAINGAIGILLQDNEPNFVFPEHSKLSVGEIVKRLKSLKPQPKQEWNEEGETKQDCSSIDIRASISHSNNETIKNIISYLSHERKTTREEIESSFIPCLKRLLNRMELSEEDEVMIELIADSLKCLLEEHRNSIADSQIQKEIAWLKSLSPNKKQEWSGVNEKVVMCCKFLRDALLCIDYDDSHKKDIEKCIQWLNSLRPQNHWKPNEEQLISLELSIKYLLTQEQYIKVPLLESLYNDLKKL